ncbi:MAG: polyphenol oxidase family protein [Syntrophomonadaceae bacterium]|jgi:YfiH family protein|nr:polyphenol oxidase family protein [Syntrophomonadaceae bacterium]MDH7498308.1 polyphenol oxidase family protein [Syntrophomonadaceae bacterium]
MERWEWRQAGELRYLVLPGWEERGVLAAVSTRRGGVSRGDFASLNLALHVGDDPRAVRHNRRRWAQALGIEAGHLVCARQVHGARAAVVGEQHRGMGVWEEESACPDCDVMLTDARGVYLMMCFADCIPVLLFDPVRRAVGLAHCGWKGTLEGAAAVAVQAMQRQLGCVPGRMRAFIGPGIGGCCYQVGAEVVARAMGVFGDSSPVLRRGAGGVCMDLVLANRLLLERAGVPPANVAAAGLCTACLPDLLYSYRRAGGRTGRFGVTLGLQPG